MQSFYANIYADSQRSYRADWNYAMFLLQNKRVDHTKAWLHSSLQSASESDNINKEHFMEQARSYPDLLSLLPIAQTFFEIQFARQEWDSVIKNTDKYFFSLGTPHRANYQKAFAFFQKKEYAEAEKIIKLALQNNTDSDSSFMAQIYSTQGDIYFQWEKYKNSYQAYEKALKYAPQNIVLLNNYAYYLSLRGKDLKKALVMSKATVEKEPEMATYLDTYAWILYKLERYEEAKTQFRKALLHGGDNEPVILEHYGDVLFQMGEKTNAKMYWKRALDKGNDSSELKEKLQKH
jgi:Tfp pilus assembly protein PilF